MNNLALDMEVAPLDGSPVILATKCGKVIKSQWMPNEERWFNLAKKEVPVACNRGRNIRLRGGDGDGVVV